MLFKNKAKVIFDIGACDGDYLKQFANKSNFIVYAFEPILEKALFLSGKWKNVHVAPIAIDESGGWKKFNYNKFEAASSLLSFSPDVLKNWKINDLKEDISQTSERLVFCQRLDEFCFQRGISHISVLKTDTQGNDLSVLRSLGAYLEVTEQIIVEVPAGNEPLYREGATRADIEKYLTSNGFRCVLEEIQSLGQEFNLHFVK
jgi:FkbM family methyltransferase